MAEHRAGPEDSSFSWPPSASDLAAAQLVDLRLIETPVTPTRQVRPSAGGGTRHALTRPRHRTARGTDRGVPPPWGWLAAGVLLGAVLPGRVDTAPPTRIGQASAVMGAALMPAAETAPPATRTATTPAIAASGHGIQASPAPASSVRLAAAPASPAVPETTTIPVPRRHAPRVTDAATRSVLSTVQTFGAAWSRLDATSTRRVWPAADGAVLARAFTGISEQRLTLRGCAVSVDRQDATARCAGTLRYRPRAGDHATRTRYGPWAFALERQHGGWVITTVKAPR